MGGYVYPCTKYASLKGSYIFGDYNQGELYAISFIDGTIAQITGPATPLPVKFENFTARGSGCSIDLQWTTSFESNFSHFEVERSADGKTFGRI